MPKVFFLIGLLLVVRGKVFNQTSYDCGSYNNPCLIGGSELLGRGIWLPFLNPEYLSDEERREGIQDLVNGQSVLIDIGEPTIKLIGSAYYLFPEHVDCYQISECSQDVYSYVSKDETSFYNQWQRSLGIKIPLPGLFSFKRSRTYKESCFYHYQKETIVSAGYQSCSVASCKLKDSFELKDEFKEEISKLPRFMETQEEIQVYLDFIRKYGSSFTFEVNVGARAMTRYVLTKESEKYLSTQGITVSTGITNMFRTKAGLEVSSSWKNGQQQIWESTTEEQVTKAVGGNPFLAFQDNKAWFESIKSFDSAREVTNFKDVRQIHELVARHDKFKADNMVSALEYYFIQEEPAPYDVIQIASISTSKADEDGESETVRCPYYNGSPPSYTFAGSCKLTDGFMGEKSYKLAASIPSPSSYSHTCVLSEDYKSGTSYKRVTAELRCYYYVIDQRRCLLSSSCREKHIKAIGGYTYTSYNQRSLPFYKHGEKLSQSCPSRMKIIGGGCDTGRTSPESSQWQIKSSYPSSSGTAWKCQAHADHGVKGDDNFYDSIGSYVVCGDISSDVLQTVKSSGRSCSPSSYCHDEVSCPTGYFLLGGGCQVLGETSELIFWKISQSYAQDNKWHCDFARDYDWESSNSQFVYAHVICHKDLTIINNELN